MLSNFIYKNSEKDKKKELSNNQLELLEWIRKTLNFFSKKIVQSLDLKSHVDYIEKMNIENKRIAIVWNSPNLNNSNYWEEIDNHDIVFRLNSWIIKSSLSKEKTWLKTSIWWTWAISTLVHPNIWKEIDEMRWNTKEILLCRVDKPQWEQEYFYYLYTIFHKLRWFDLYFTPSELYEELVKILSKWANEKNIPSTWLIFFILLSQLTKNNNRLSVYGFTFSNEHRIMTPTKKFKHNFEEEKRIIMKIVDENKKIDFYE